MESSSPTPPNMEFAKPLSEFQKIGYNIYLWSPPAYRSQSTANAPLILMFSWNGAAAKHIAKYTVAYQKLFPTSRILLVRCFTRDWFRRTTEYGPLLKPAIDLVHEHTKAGGEILVHSFSNGGGSQSNEFAKAWKTTYGSMMPMRIQVMDSAPTKAAWMRSHKAMSMSLPKTLFWRWFGSALIHLLLLGCAIVWTATGQDNKGVVVFRQMLDDSVFDKSVPRVYLYSRVDEMVGIEEVEEHADLAEARGWDVRRVCFEKSGHCGHIREDDKRYWGAIMDAWNKAS